MEKPRNHFIGSIVTQPVPDAPERAAKFTPIDGQQRLTTLFLILSVIKREASDSDIWPGLSDEIHDMCLTNKWAHSEDEQLKLRPTQKDRAPFTAAITGQALDGTTQIGRAYNYFWKALRKGDADGIQPGHRNHEKAPVTCRF